jgi:hypothetical protein
MTQYLYGAKVQGIQSYIFETNRLQDIGGGSELIESLSGEGFVDFFAEVGVRYNKDQLLRNAAGEISYLFTHKGDCEKVVRNFENFIATKMPGLSVSQAVVELSGDFAKLQDASRQVNRQLQIQRNRPTPPSELGWMISERARRTGRPGVDYDKKDGLIDRRQQSKREAAKNHWRLHEKLIGSEHRIEPKHLALNLEDITNGHERSWLAVVHADGNNLGKLIQKLLSAIPDERLLEGYRKFSKTLESATVAAAQSAYASLLEAIKTKNKAGEQEYDDIIAGKIKLPIRPVVIGGDDLTVILRAEHAVAFTEAYLAAFERETKKLFSDYVDDLKLKLTDFNDGLTACAGIAIIKSKYPFHYAAHLAEELCSWTKKVVKQEGFKGAPSALHFHKVQASFVEDYKAIIAREQTTVDEKQLLTAGPYFVNAPPENYKTVDQLLGYVQTLKKKETPAGPLRDYVGELRVDMGAAAQRLNRIRDLNEKATTPLDLHDDRLFVARGTETKPSTHLYDAIQLSNL